MYIDPATKDVNYMMFSGQQPPTRMNETLKVCNVDLMRFRLSQLKWKRMKAKGQVSTIIGRKNHALSYCSSYVHVCSGADARTTMLNDYMIFD